MAARQIYNPEGFKNIEKNGVVIGYQFQFKAQYYRGITLSIIRDIQIRVDDEEVKREDIRFSVNGETFTLEQMRTVIDPDYRWEFGEFATVSVIKDGGLSKGQHHIHARQIIAPSYMPFQIEADCDTDFVID
ncbi:C-glycoside deglycosidase beta subunit domain-containing protein [Sharpea azabuensis]|nr:hypothetical protein [Erysipelotrichaceae bacterium]HBG85018.1 hypothetical protein [Erysipelotrichaceae bacterium]HBZ51514.1 hypothetical protein [Erysipelotrichaceae bacterium]HCG96500.1 hypothetical protein [Erysipelotrichaceae bacterium]